MNDRLTEGQFVYESSQTPIDFVPNWITSDYFEYDNDPRDCVLIYNESSWKEYDCEDFLQMGTLCEEVTEREL